MSTASTHAPSTSRTPAGAGPPDVRTRRRVGLAVGGLLLLSAVPSIAGALRLTELARGAEVTEANARFFAAPGPVVVHIVAATVFCVLGAFQFVPGLRRRPWHRIAGRVLVPMGLLAALSGLWMTLFYPRPEPVGDLLSGVRVIVATAMVLSIAWGLVLVRRRDIARHRRWMVRGYALGQGAGTQVLTLAPWTVLVGAPGEVLHAALMTAGWVINVVVAEWLLRRRPRRARTPAAGQRTEPGPTIAPWRSTSPPPR